ncbi:MAG TPA: S41 family peptidase [Allosphingosinicella sp.]|nr:S41 family peptidase [Allosphingosinicella sp.]
MDRRAKGPKVGVRHKRFSASVAMLALLSACGGGGGGGGGSPGDGGGVVPPPIAAPPATPAACSLRDRQDWTLAQLQEWYLFPELLATNVNPDSHSSVQSYIDALVAPARAQNKDRIFTYIVSLSEHDALLNSGASGGFGLRLSTDAGAGRVFVSESFEGTPALNANIDRGTEILAIGTNASDLVTVSSIIASQGTAGVTNALGPSTIGLSRLFRVRDLNGATRDVTLTRASYTVDPVSDRYGALVLDDNGKKVGYINFRTFIGAPAENDLRAAFAQFKTQGITEVIVDLRYNGGGLVNTALLFSSLLMGNRSAPDVILNRTYRASKANLNATHFFNPQPQSIAATKIAFIGTGATASSSEIVMNAALPYLGPNAGLIGSNTFGKPVGQAYLNRPACDDRLISLAFNFKNANQQGDYFNGLASNFQSSCRADDDFLRPLGDPKEAMIRTALDFLAGRACTPIGSGASTQSLSGGAGARQLLTPAQPNASQSELPGVF